MFVCVVDMTRNVGASSDGGSSATVVDARELILRVNTTLIFVGRAGNLRFPVHGVARA